MSSISVHLPGAGPSDSISMSKYARDTMIPTASHVASSASTHTSSSSSQTIQTSQTASINAADREQTQPDASTDSDHNERVTLSTEGREKLANALHREPEQVEETEASEKEKLTAQLEKQIRQLKERLQEIMLQIEETKNDSSLDAETKDMLLSQYYTQLSSTQAMLLNATQLLIEAKRKLEKGGEASG